MYSKCSLFFNDFFHLFLMKIVNPIPDCPEGEFKCRGSSRISALPGNRCILNRFRCDGDNDCGIIYSTQQFYLLEKMYL